MNPDVYRLRSPSFADLQRDSAISGRISICNHAQHSIFALARGKQDERWYLNDLPSFLPRKRWIVAAAHLSVECICRRTRLDGIGRGVQCTRGELSHNTRRAPSSQRRRRVLEMVLTMGLLPEVLMMPLFKFHSRWQKVYRLPATRPPGVKDIPERCWPSSTDRNFFHSARMRCAIATPDLQWCNRPVAPTPVWHLQYSCHGQG